jgi:putative addiction module antidote
MFGIIMNVRTRGALMTTLKLTAIGSSTGVVIPKEMLARLKVGKGDTLFAVETAEGYLITPYDPTIERHIKAGQKFMKRYRETFKALAK